MPKTKKDSEEIFDEVVSTAPKAGKAAKQTTKKAVLKVAKKPVKEQIYLQYKGREVSQEDLMRRVKEIWTKQLKRKVSEMASVTFYLKPEENKAYYVINGEESGSLDM